MSAAPATLALLLVAAALGLTRGVAEDGPAAVRLDVRLLDGRRLNGTLESVAPELGVATDDGLVRLDWSELLEVQPLPEVEGAAAGGDPLRFRFADGSQVGGVFAGEREDNFGLRQRDGRTLWCRGDAVTGISAPRSSADVLGRLEAAARDRPEDEDFAVVSHDGRVAELRGAVLGMSEAGVRFQYGQRTLTLPWDRLGGVVYRRRPERDASAVVWLANGDAVAGRVVGGGPDAVIVQSGAVGRVSLAWPRVTRIEVRSERVLFLSDVDAYEYEFEPFFERRWEPAFNQTLSGGPIVLAGREYRRGIVVHSRATLRYPLNGRFARFVALAGVIDELGGLGNVRMAVLGDGELLWERTQVRGGAAPEEVIVDVAHVRTLELLVDYGEDFDVGDHACWAMARLIR